MKNRDIKAINALCRISSHELYLRKIPKDEVESYIIRQLFRDALNAMIEERDTLPIELMNRTDGQTAEEIYKLRFWIIGEEALKDFEKSAALGQAYQWAYENGIVVADPESLVKKFMESE